MNYQAIGIREKDNVATILRSFSKGDEIKVKIEDRFESIVLDEDIPSYHKFALKRISPGEKVYKYGEVIGEALSEIKEGSCVHVHNLKSLRG